MSQRTRSRASSANNDANGEDGGATVATAEAPEGQVVQQMRKGYRLRDRLIRPAMVVVAKKP